MKKPLRLFIIFLTLFTFTSIISWAQKPEQVRYETVEITENKLIYRIYKYSEDKAVDLTDLDIWGKTPSNISLKISNTDQPDKAFKLLLLQRGYAKIKEGSSVPDEFKKAQNEAQRDAVGQWKPVPTPPPPSNSKNTPAPSVETPAPSVETPAPSVETPTPTPLPTPNPYIKYVTEIVLPPLLVILLSGSVVLAIIGLIYKFLIRRKLFLVFLGVRSVGKTTIYKRMFHPGTTPEECYAPKTTLGKGKFKATQSVNWGGYEVTPYYIDTPGGKVGEQAFEMLKSDGIIRRILRPSRFVWIIALAPTDMRVDHSSSENEKVSESFMNEQFGYLSLPLGLLQHPKVRFSSMAMTLFGYSLNKPNLVILCINKFDIFTDNPNDKITMAKVRNLFARHIELVENGCKQSSIDTEVSIISACSDWNVRSLRDLIELKLYTK